MQCFKSASATAEAAEEKEAAEGEEGQEGQEGGEKAKQLVRSSPERRAVEFSAPTRRAAARRKRYQWVEGMREINQFKIDNYIIQVCCN